MKLVIKLSGKVLEDSSLRHRLAEQIAHLSVEGHRLLIVHGGGKQLSQLCRKLNIPVIQYDGRRVTDQDTLEAAKMVFSAINLDLTAALGSSRVKAVGFSAFDGGLTQAKRRPPIAVGSGGSGERTKVDFGLVGEITSIDPSLIESLWAAGYVPVVSCLCTDSLGQILNINADTLAAELALALRADRLISVSNVDGIYRDPSDESTLLRSLTVSQAQQCLAQGVFLDGMIPKVQTALAVLARGLPGFQILSGVREGALVDGLKGTAGTIIRADR